MDNIPFGAFTSISLAPGYDMRVCGVKQDGTAVCWSHSKYDDRIMPTGRWRVLQHSTNWVTTEHTPPSPPPLVRHVW